MRLFQQIFLCIFISLLLSACSWVQGLIGYDDKPDPDAIVDTPVCAQLSANDCKDKGKKLLAKNNSQSDAMALVFFVQACKKLNVEACNQSGIMYKTGLGTGKNIKQAIDRFSNACDIDKKSGCYEVALAYRNGDSVKKDLDIAAQYFDYTCNNASLMDKNKGKSCTQKGFLLSDKAVKDKTAIQEVYKAFEYFLKGCKAGDGEGCFQVASAYQAGRGVAGSDDYARDYYVLGCNAKVGESCLWAGHMNASINPLDASDYYYTGCSYNNKESCFELAERYRLGKAMTKNNKMAEITYQQVCSKNIPIACYWQANLLQQQAEELAETVAPEEKKSIIDAYEIACDAGLTLACYQLAIITHKGLWVDKNPPVVAQYLTRHCNEKEWFGCFDLALLYQSGTGVAASPQTSVKLFKQVCDADKTNTPITLQLLSEAEQIAQNKQWLIHACWQLAEMLWEYPPKEAEEANKTGAENSVAKGNNSLQKVKALVKNNKTALDYYNKACQLGWSPACLTYVMVLDKGLAIDKDAKQAFKYYLSACRLDEHKSLRNLFSSPCCEIDKQKNICLENTSLSSETKKSSGSMKACSKDFYLPESLIISQPDSIMLAAKNGNHFLDNTLQQQSIANACYNLAVDFRDGIGVDKSEPKAIQLFKQSCLLKQGWGCYNYALSLSESELSTLYFEKSCELGYQEACSLILKTNNE